MFKKVFGISFQVVMLFSKWKGDKHSVQSIKVSSLGSHLLSAGRSIKLWDLNTKNVLQVGNAVINRGV